jgi:phosphate:Na+ symporter
VSQILLIAAQESTETFHIWPIVIGLVGGLALFLYGMDKISDGLRSVAGDGLRTLLAKLTANRFKAVLTGLIVTGVIQSSSLTTVLVIGFISAGLMTLRQSIGVIMGANIGTTLTIQIAAFKITHYSWLLVALGFVAMAISRRDSLRQTGSVLLGLGLLFLAVEQMSSATRPLQDSPWFTSSMQQMENPVHGILAGALFTAIIQSSSATTGVIIALVGEGLMTLPAAICVALGANVGTCSTAWIASTGKIAEARRAAVIHLIFNLSGVAVWMFLIPQMETIVRWFSDETMRQVANAHTIFNVLNTAVLIWFVGPLARLAEWLVPYKPGAAIRSPDAPRFLDDTLLSTPSLAVDRLRLETGHLGEVVVRTFDQAGSAVLHGTRSELADSASAETTIDQLFVAIVDYARRLARQELSTAETKSLETCLAAANYLESAGDVICSNLTAQGMRRIEKSVSISPSTQEVLHNLHRFVGNSMQHAIAAFQRRDKILAEQVVSGKEEFNQLSADTLDRLRQRLMADGPTRVTIFQMEVDIVGQYQRIHYLARRLAKLALQSLPRQTGPNETDRRDGQKAQPDPDQPVPPDSVREKRE